MINKQKRQILQKYYKNITFHKQVLHYAVLKDKIQIND